MSNAIRSNVTVSQKFLRTVACELVQRARPSSFAAAVIVQLDSNIFYVWLYIHINSSNLWSLNFLNDA